MKERITKLEAFTDEALRRFDRLELAVDRLRQELNEHRVATKHDIDNAIKWIVGVMLAISMAAVTIITFVLNYATPKAAPPLQQPIVIYATAPPAAGMHAPGAAPSP